MADKVLIIDGDSGSLDSLSSLLRRQGYDVVAAASAQTGLRQAYSQQPDLVLLEADLPDREGWTVCRQLRDMSDLPIIFLSALNEPADIVKGLQLGADDYVGKPYDDAVLLARIQARLRRSPGGQPKETLAFEHGELRINFMNREVSIRDQIKHLTPKEFNLLAVLARQSGRLVTRRDLVTEAWGEEYSDATDSLKLYIHYLRKKLETNPQQPEYILTTRGVGYRLARR